MTVEVTVPPPIPSEESLLVGDTKEVRKKSGTLIFEESVRVDEFSWDASKIGDELRAQYMITMQRDKVLVQGLFEDHKSIENPALVPDVSKLTN